MPTNIKGTKVKKPRNTESRAARILAVQALYQQALSDMPAAALLEEYLHYQFSAFLRESDFSSVNRSLFVRLVEGVQKENAPLREILQANLKAGFTVERLELVKLYILLCGLYEILHLPEVPAAVVINEYLEVAKGFLGGREPAFVNQVLDTVAKTARSSEFAATHTA